MNPNFLKRIPKKGDHVAVRDQTGIYEVYSVDGTLHSVDLSQIGNDLRLATIPWRSIHFLDDDEH
jgi:hypothetical protein